MAADIEVPVLIVGGGGAGLTASMLLSQLKIESLLISALPTTSVLPKAHVLNQRTMEILADVGVAEEIYRIGTPPHQMALTGFYAGFAGHPDAGRCLARLEAWGAGGADPDYVQASPYLATNLPQIRLEPVLRRRAEELAPGRVRFHHELVSFTQDDEGVNAVVRDLDSDTTYTVTAAYLLACDGGRTVGPSLGIEMEGIRQAGREVSIHMTSDLSGWAGDPEVLIRWIWVPHQGTLAVLVPMGPTRWGPESEEWVFHLNYPFEDPRALDDAKVEADMRDALGIGDHDVAIHKITRWTLEGVIASRWRTGRVFLLGDAAHRHPPTGGLGLTSAVQDAHNLCWKLAAVLADQASDGLLDTYEPERRSSVTINVDNSLASAMNHLAIGSVLGLLEEGLNHEQAWARISRAWSDDPADREQRTAVRDILASQSMEFRKLNVEYGYTYSSSAIIDDGTPAVDPIDPIRTYVPTTRPGSPLPHAWVEADIGSPVSTLHLVRPGRFLLVTGEDGDAWRSAAAAVADKTGVDIDTASIGHLCGDYLDPRCVWMRQRNIGPAGAILVRPDRFVAWRSAGTVADPERELAAAVIRILSRDAASVMD
jgi:2,4-dichlorophenol 6-monooxygenase